MATKSKKKNNSRAEDAVLEQSYRKTAGKYAKKKPKKQRNGFVIALCILIPLLLLAGFAYFYFNFELDDNRIMENVSVAGVDVGGMTKDEALIAVQSSLDKTLKQQPMIVIVLDQQVELSPALTGISIDVEAAVDAAYKLGRSGSSVQQKEEQLLASTGGIDTDIAQYLTINEEAIVNELNKLDIDTSGSLVQTVWEIQGEAPDLHADEAPVNLQTLMITKGSPAYSYDPQLLTQQIIKAYSTGALTVTCDMAVTEPDPLDLDAIYAQYCNEVADAQMDPETFVVQPHTYGYGFDLDAARQAFDEAGYGDVLEFPFSLTLPGIYSADLSSVLFRDVLSSYDAFQASNNSRATNMRIACEAINGTILLPGEVFSFNETVGERTAAKGYQTAPSYEGGKTVMTYGGGVCQPSSTIYYCALLADLEIVERDCHSYPSYYVPWGMDATVNWGTLDFKFRNNTQYPIRIDASADDKGTVSIALVGTDTKDHYIDMEYEILAYYPHEVKEIHFSEDNNPKGYYDGQVITSPVDGYKVRTYRCRYNKETDELIERVEEDISIYSKRDKEVAVMDVPETTAPPATEPPATEPPATEPPVTEPPVAEPLPPADTPSDVPAG